MLFVMCGNLQFEETLEIRLSRRYTNIYVCIIRMDRIRDRTSAKIKVKVRGGPTESDIPAFNGD